jgi:hypothetical protein
MALWLFTGTFLGVFMSVFLGREYELELLNSFLSKKAASLVVIKGRRRIGKSRLAEEFAKKFTFYSFSGLPPHNKTSNSSERGVFLRTSCHLI